MSVAMQVLTMVEAFLIVSIIGKSAQVGQVQWQKYISSQKIRYHLLSNSIFVINFNYLTPQQHIFTQKTVQYCTFQSQKQFWSQDFSFTIFQTFKLKYLETTKNSFMHLCQSTDDNFYSFIFFCQIYSFIILILMDTQIQKNQFKHHFEQQYEKVICSKLIN